MDPAFHSNPVVPELFCREVTNVSGTNLNIGVYDNGLKGAGQEARSNYDRCHERDLRALTQSQ